MCYAPKKYHQRKTARTVYTEHVMWLYSSMAKSGSERVTRVADWMDTHKTAMTGTTGAPAVIKITNPQIAKKTIFTINH